MDIAAAEAKRLRVSEEVFVVLAADSSESIHLALLDFFDDADGTLFIGEVIAGKLPGESLTVAAHGTEETLDVGE